MAANYNFKDILGKSLIAKTVIEVYDKPDGIITQYVFGGNIIGKVVDWDTVNKDPWAWIEVWKVFEDRWLWYKLEDGSWFRYDDSGSQFSIQGSDDPVIVTTAATDIENVIKTATDTLTITAKILPWAIGLGLLIVASNLSKELRSQ